MFDTSWELVKRYEIPESFRLKPDQLTRYVEIIKEVDAQKRLRRLEYCEDEFRAYPPFWYYKGKACQDLARAAGDSKVLADKFNQQAMACYEAFDAAYLPILNADPYLASVAMNRIMLTDLSREPARIRELLGIIKKSAKHDPGMMQFTAIQHIRLDELDQAEMLLIAAVDKGANVRLNTRILGDIYSGDTIEAKLPQLIEQSVHSDDVKQRDVLYLIGKAKDETIVNRYAEQLSLIKPVWDKALVGRTGSVRMEIPKSWFYDELDLSLQCGGEIVEAEMEESKIDIQDNIISIPTALEIDASYVALGGHTDPLVVLIKDPQYAFRSVYSVHLVDEAIEFKLTEVAFGENMYRLEGSKFVASTSDDASPRFVDLLKVVIKELSAKNKDMHSFPNIDTGLLKKCRNDLSIPKEEIIFGAYDALLKGELAFSQSRIYWKGFKAEPGSIRYQDLNKTEVSANDAEELILGDATLVVGPSNYYLLNLIQEIKKLPSE